MSKATKNKIAKNKSFKELVEAIPDIAVAYNAGLRAMGGYSKLIELGENTKCDGSVDIDVATTHKYPGENRWDYVFSYKSVVYFVEVHSAETGEVRKVLRKLQWLKDWLNAQAPEINKLKAKIPYYRIQSGRYNLQKNSPQFRQVTQAGIKPISKLSIS